MREGFILVLVTCLVVACEGQNPLMKDSMDTSLLMNRANLPDSLVKFRLSHDLEYSLYLSNLLFLNWMHGNDASLVSAYHQLKYRFRITGSEKVQFSNSFSHELGVRYFFDSIASFQPDENIMDSRAEVHLIQNFSVSVFSNLTTRMFNSYQYTTGNLGKPARALVSAFMTPLTWTFSAGLGWNIIKTGSLSVGLTSAKFTWVRNKSVYDRPDVVEFYGVKKGKSTLFEYGLSLHLLVDKEIAVRIHWNCDLLVFKNYLKPFDMAFKNLVGIRIGKFLKTSIQTHLYYEKEVSPRIQVENLVSVGLYFIM